MTDTVKMGLKFSVAAACLLAIARIPRVQWIMGSSVGWIASYLLRACWGQPIEWFVTNRNTMGLSLQLGATHWDAEVAIMPVIRNIPLVMAVSALQRRETWHWRRFVRFSVIATLSMLWLDASLLIALVWPDLALRSGIGIDGPWRRGIYQLVQITRTYWSTGGLLLAPVFVAVVATGSAIPPIAPKTDRDVAYPTH